jgi:threonine dehydratase
MFESLKAGKIIKAHRHEPKTIAEGLSGGIEAGSITFEIVQKYVDEVFLVREEQIRHAVYLLCEKEKQRVEGSGATSVALLLNNKEFFENKIVALVLTGGNIDDLVLENIIEWET